MSRPTRTIKLSTCEVDVIVDLKWGEKESLQNVLLTGAKMDATGLKEFDPGVMYESKIKLMEIGVMEIRDGDKKLKFSKEWAENLSADDGDLLFEELDKLNKKKEA